MRTGFVFTALASSFVGLAIIAILIGKDDERYVITGSDQHIIYKHEFSKDANSQSAVISMIKEFSKDYGMDFLLAQRNLEDGDFIASANIPKLNIRAMHVARAGDRGILVIVVVPNSPSKDDKNKVNDFIARLERLH